MSVNLTNVPQGVIIPPPEIRSAVEKTADYVLRNGRGFEHRIVQSERNNPKFSFLLPDDNYHAFYQWLLRQMEEGANVDTVDSSGSSGKQPTPRELSFLVSQTVPALDLDIIKTTAMYAAANGEHFVSTLKENESKNPQFAFLASSHSYHSLFRNLIAQYQSVLQPSEDLLSRIKEGAQDEYSLLAAAKSRAEFNAQRKEEDEKRQAEEEAKQRAFLEVDWNNIELCETVLFTPADLASALPAPVSKAQLQFATLEGKRQGYLFIEEAPPDFEEGPLPDTENKNLEEVSDDARAAPFKGDTDSKPPSTDTGSKPPPTVTQPHRQGIKIREAGARRGRKIVEAMVKSEFTGEMIPEAEYNDHVRIMLLDPKWKDQKNLAETRQATSNLTTANIAENMKRMRSALEEPDGERKRSKSDAAPVDYANVSKGQLRHIRKKIDREAQNGGRGR